MPDRKYTYRVEVDTSSARRAGATLRREIQESLRNINVAASATGVGKAARGGGGGSAAAGGAAAGMSLGDISRGARNVLTAGGLTLVAGIAAQYAGYVVEAGKVGAQNERLREGFFKLAEGANLSGEAIVNGLRPALNGAVDDMTLMAETNLLLVAAQDNGIKITESQIATLGKFALIRSRELMAQGKALTAQEAYARIIRGVVKRETEILDELGLSTKLLAETLGTSTKEVNNSVDSLLAAILKVADMEIPKYGEEFNTQADLMEQAAARSTNAANQIRETLSDPALWVKQAQAGLTELAADFLGIFAGDNIGNIIPKTIGESILNEMFKQMMDEARSMGVGGSALLQAPLAKALESLKAAGTAGSVRAQAQGGTFAEQRTRVAALSVEVNRLADIYARINEMKNRGALDPGVVAQLTAGWGNLVAGMRSGENAMLPLNVQVDILEQNLKDSLPAALQLGVALGTIGQAVFGIGSAAKVVSDLTEEIRALYFEQQFVAGVADKISKSKDSQFRQQLAGGDTSDRIALLTEEIGKSTTTFERELQLREQLAGEYKTLAREQEAALKANTSALNAARSSYESALQGIPGLFGGSDVTQKQLDLAKMGVPQNFVDDYLRRLTDEVVNGVNWDNVDIGEAARAAGINPNLPAEAILTLFTDAWQNSSLFANPENIKKFIDDDAVIAGLERQRQSDLGRQNLFGAFPGAEALFGPDGLKDIGTPIAQQLAGSLPGAIRNSGLGASAMSAVQDEITNPDVLGPRTTAIGAGIAAGIFAGFGEAVPGYAWGDVVMSQVYADIAVGQQTAAAGFPIN